MYLKLNADYPLMSEDSDQPKDQQLTPTPTTVQQLKPLPAEKLRNPGEGDGALGNERTGHMYYKGKDKKELVITVQKMLKTLAYDLGTSGRDGVDGKFEDKTEEAVRDFQGKNKNWDGEQLKVDGLVGPETSDALNRAMVGQNYENHIWYDHYQTPKKLVEGKPYHTVTTNYMNSGLLIKSGTAKAGKVFLVGQIPETTGEATLTIRLVGFNGQYVGNANYSLNVESRQFVGQTNEADGTLSHKISKNAKTGKLILDTITYDLIIYNIVPANTINGALIRLSNLGYLITPSEKVQKTENKKEEQKSEELQLVLMQFQRNYDLEVSGKLDEPTIRKLEEVYGS